MLEFDTCILGGGWAGLLVAKKLIDTGNSDIALIEANKEGHMGGLLKSEVIDGFTFDCGGPHLLFSKDKSILSEVTGFLKANSSQRIRNNFVFYKNQYVQYPFENGIYHLPIDERIKFVKGIVERMLFIARNSDWKPKNFLEWITGFFGEYMAEEYLIPYNKKIWKRPLDEMASDWVFSPGRLPFPELEDMLLTVAGVPSIGYKEQAYFYYPNFGGIAALYSSLLSLVTKGGAKILEGEKVVKLKINTDDMFNINGKINAKRTISTIPLPELLLSLDDINNYRGLAEKFDYNSVVVVGVAIKGGTPNQTSVYIPDSRIIFHRYTWMSSLNPLQDQNKSNLIAEVTIPKDEKINLKEITKEVIKGLLKIGVIEDENAVLFTKVWFNKYGYPIYSLEHNEIRRDAMNILESHGIKSVGRLGSWHYWNTDMVYNAVMKMNIERSSL